MTSRFDSISRIPITLTINQSQILNGELIRHLSPLTINRLIKNFPLKERINNFQNKFIYIKVNVELGHEKSVNSFKRGDIAFSPASNFLCIFLSDYIHNQKFNLLGKVNLDNIELLQNIKTGDFLSINKSIK